MSRPALVRALEHVRATAGRPTPLGDDLLLARFAADRDEAAFAELVRRHGPLVRDVARRRLGDAHEADDVAQATFLALARQAGRLNHGRPLAGWLFTVAHRLACKAQVRAARRDQVVVQASRLQEAALHYGCPQPRGSAVCTPNAGVGRPSGRLFHENGTS